MVKKNALFAAVLSLIMQMTETAKAGEGAQLRGLAACQAVGLTSCPEPMDEKLPLPAEMLTWDQATRIVGFRNTFRLYRGDAFHTLGVSPYPLPPAPHRLSELHYRLDGQTFGMDDYLHHQDVTGLLVLKDGRVAYEYYGGGNTQTTLWTSRSVGKSVVSVLVGIAIKEGYIHSVQDRITRYLPELKGTAWDGVTLQNLLQHTSGIAWNEDYADPHSDFAQLTRCESQADAYSCVLRLVSTLKRKPGVKPGEVWSYNTGGAWLVGLLLERATHMTLARFLETRLWSRFAMEHDGVWESLDTGKVDMGGHGFNATLRDWGRFGLFVMREGKLSNGDSLLPGNWMAKSIQWTRAKDSVTPDTPDGIYGYQWWSGGLLSKERDTDGANATASRTFRAEGIYGQSIAINPKEQLVIVQWSSWAAADGSQTLYDEGVLFANAVARSLRNPD
jgi:CubicO group peptidase (beta-lactamase class C family)